MAYEEDHFQPTLIFSVHSMSCWESESAVIDFIIGSLMGILSKGVNVKDDNEEKGESESKTFLAKWQRMQFNMVRNRGELKLSMLSMFGMVHNIVTVKGINKYLNKGVNEEDAEKDVIR
jgi:hypothetical protein